MWFLLLALIGTSPADETPTNATADASPEAPAEPAVEREWVFMPAIELGLIWHPRPSIAPSLVTRTSLEYRFARIRSPFVRLTYDTAAPRFSVIGDTGDEELVATLGLHDVYIGGGYRYGPERVQFIAGTHIGLQITQVPFLAEAEEGTLVVDTRVDVTGLALLDIGMEVYIREAIALTLDLSGRTRFRPLPGASHLGLTVTVGVATAF